MLLFLKEYKYPIIMRVDPIETIGFFTGTKTKVSNKTLTINNLNN